MIITSIGLLQRLFLRELCDAKGCTAKAQYVVRMLGRDYWLRVYVCQKHRQARSWSEDMVEGAIQ